MNKITFTEVFLRDMHAGLVASQSTKNSPTQRRSLPKLNRLEPLVALELPLGPQTTKESRNVRRLTVFQKSRQLELENSKLLEDTVGVSVNEALHRFMPADFPFKNSNLSNYNFLKCAKEQPLLRQRLFPILTKSLADAGRLKDQARTTARKVEQVTTERERINASLKKILDQRSKQRIKETETEPTRFFLIQRRMSECHEISKFVDQYVEGARVRDDVRKKSQELYKKYHKVWKCNRDFSLKKAIVFRAYPGYEISGHN